MNEAKQLEIKKIFKEKWGEITSKEIMEWFIFWPIATNEHYNVDEIEEVRLGLGKQIDVVVSEIRNKMNWSYVVTPQVIDLETGEITQKVWYFKVASKTALIDSIHFI